MTIASHQVQCCPHLRQVLDPNYRKGVIDKCVKTLRKHTKEFDAIVVSGYSMALIAPCVADKLGKNLVIVRKNTEVCASDYTVEGVTTKNYIIIDDLICSRVTFHRVTKNIQVHINPQAKCVGIYLYSLWESSIQTQKYAQELLGCPILNEGVS